MKTTKVKVPFKEGLHARPASELVKICLNIESDIVLTKDDIDVDPKSILGIMTLGAAYGDELTLEVTGEDEDQAIKSLEKFFAESD